MSLDETSGMFKSITILIEALNFYKGFKLSIYLLLLKSEQNIPRYGNKFFIGISLNMLEFLTRSLASISYSKFRTGAINFYSPGPSGLTLFQKVFFFLDAHSTSNIQLEVL
jgi:hypothetical protein